jgi:hypothetical protein
VGLQGGAADGSRERLPRVVGPRLIERVRHISATSD